MKLQLSFNASGLYRVLLDPSDNGDARLLSHARSDLDFRARYCLASQARLYLGRVPFGALALFLRAFRRAPFLRAVSTSLYATTT